MNLTSRPAERAKEKTVVTIFADFRDANQGLARFEMLKSEGEAGAYEEVMDVYDTPSMVAAIAGTLRSALEAIDVDVKLITKY